MHHGPELTIVVVICFTLLLGAAIQLLGRRLHVPYSIAMLVIGLLTGLLVSRIGGHGPLATIGAALSHGSAISPDLIILIFLPALVFESAFALEVHAFRQNAAAVLILAVPALVVSTLVIGLFMLGLTSLFSWEWSLVAALAFGALISATDPVAVVALLRELGAPKRLALLIEGESLLNDGTSIVVFSVVFGLLTGASELALGGTLLEFAWVFAGGIAVGLLLAIGVSRWLSRAFNEPLVEIALTLALAYLAMLIAEGFLHVSGVMAVVAAGLWMAGPGRTHISPEIAHFLHRFWEVLSYLANTLIFFLVGLIIATQIQDARLLDLVLVIATFVGIMLVRFALMYGFRPLINRVGSPISRGEATAMAWGGLRGAVSLALGLVVSQHPDLDPELRREILLVTAGVVLLTILVNGSTMPLILRKLGFDRPPVGDRLAQYVTTASVLARVQSQIGRISRSRDLRTVNWAEVESELESRKVRAQERIESTRRELQEADATERVRGYWRQVLNMERQAYWTAFAHGTLSARATQILDHEIDLQLDCLARGEDRPPDTRSPSLTGLRARLARWLQSRGAFGKLQFELLELRYDLARGETLAAERVLEELDGMTEIDADVRREMTAIYKRFLRRSKEGLEDLRANLPEVTTAIETRLARRIELNFERENYEELEHLGAMDHGTAAAALAAVDRRMNALRWGELHMALPATTDLCRSAPLFEGLDEEGIQEIAGLTVEKAYSPGDVLFREGDQGDSMFIIARGAVVVVLERNGDEILLNVLGGGDILGEMSLLSGAPRTATCRAATTVTVGEISRSGFDQLMENQPRLRRGIWRTYAKRQFENQLREIPHYAHLGREDKMRWYELGEYCELNEGDPLAVESDGVIFLVTGALKASGSIFTAPALVELDEVEEVVAAGASRLVIMPAFTV